MLEANPALTVADLYTLLESTAITMRQAGYDADTGYGLMQADRALAQLASTHPLITTPTRTPTLPFTPTEPTGGDASDLTSTFTPTPIRTPLLTPLFTPTESSGAAAPTRTPTFTSLPPAVGHTPTLTPTSTPTPRMTLTESPGGATPPFLSTFTPTPPASDATPSPTTTPTLAGGTDHEPSFQIYLPAVMSP